MDMMQMMSQMMGAWGTGIMLLNLLIGPCCSASSSSASLQGYSVSWAGVRRGRRYRRRAPAISRRRVTPAANSPTLCRLIFLTEERLP